MNHCAREALLNLSMNVFTFFFSSSLLLLVAWLHTASRRRLNTAKLQIDLAIIGSRAIFRNPRKVKAGLPAEGQGGSERGVLIVVSQSGCNLYFLISVYFCLFYPVFDWISTGTDIPSNFKDIYEYPDVRFVQQNVLYLITTVLPVNDTTHEPLQKRVQVDRSQGR